MVEAVDRRLIVEAGVVRKAGMEDVVVVVVVLEVLGTLAGRERRQN